MIKLTWYGRVAAAAFLVLGCLLTLAATAFSQAPPQPQKKVQIKIVIDGKEIDLSDAKLLEHLEAAQKKSGEFKIKVAPDTFGFFELAVSPDGKILAAGKRYGTPQPDPRIEELVKAAEKIPAYTAVGVDGVVINMPDVADLDKVATVGETLRKVLPQ